MRVVSPLLLNRPGIPKVTYVCTGFFLFEFGFSLLYKVIAVLFGASEKARIQQKSHLSLNTLVRLWAFAQIYIWKGATYLLDNQLLLLE